MTAVPRPVALTCGEPSGIGPELALKAWAALRDELPICYIGDATHLPPSHPHLRIDTPQEAARAMPHGLPVLHHPFDGPRTPGTPQPAQAAQVVAVIERAVSLVQDGAAEALCTLPIHKKALQDGAGFAFPGHTEFLARLAGDVDVAMMLAGPQLRVVPATIHIALSQVPDALTPALLVRQLRLTHAGLRDLFGITQPRIAVAGLNPHAGEGGAMGREEIEIIAPVLDQLRAEGMDLRGPMSADTMFHASARARYDAAVCMYHDQALIPIKTLDFDRGVNLTLGLPFVRSSPDHGTALDIAGTGICDATSTIAALRLAAELAARRAMTRA